MSSASSSGSVSSSVGAEGETGWGGAEAVGCASRQHLVTQQ